MMKNWLAQSADLNPTENVWMMVKSKIGSKIFKYGIVLMTLIEKEWIAILI